MATETGRIFGHHEAEAMFEVIGNALAVIGAPASVSSSFLRELKDERSMLVDQIHTVHLALLRDCDRDPATAITNALRVLDGGSL